MGFLCFQVLFFYYIRAAKFNEIDSVVYCRHDKILGSIPDNCSQLIWSDGTKEQRVEFSNEGKILGVCPNIG